MLEAFTSPVWMEIFSSTDINEVWLKWKNQFFEEIGDFIPTKDKTKNCNWNKNAPFTKNLRGLTLEKNHNKKRIYKHPTMHGWNNLKNVPKILPYTIELKYRRLHMWKIRAPFISWRVKPQIRAKLAMLLKFSPTLHNVRSKKYGFCWEKSALNFELRYLENEMEILKCLTSFSR